MAENVIFGTGPLGLAVARRLVSSGKGVRLVNRSGKAQGPPGADVFAADVSDPAAARRACAGARVVFHCATHSYGQWDKVLPPIMNGIIEGASAASARIVYGDNLYAYGPVDGSIREDLPYRPLGPNTRARAEVATTLMDAHASGKVRATIGRASDFYGPYARQSKAGDGIFARAIAGKPAQRSQPLSSGSKVVLHAPLPNPLPWGERGPFRQPPCACGCRSVCLSSWLRQPKQMACRQPGSSQHEQTSISRPQPLHFSLVAVASVISPSPSPPPRPSAAAGRPGARQMS